MTLRDFYIAVGGDYAAACAALGGEAQVMAKLRAFPYAQDYAMLMPAIRECRWVDARACAAAISRDAAAIFCPGLAKAGAALADAVSRPSPSGGVFSLQEKLAREYRIVMAAINVAVNG